MFSKEFNVVIGDIAVQRPIFKSQAHIQTMTSNSHGAVFLGTQCLGNVPRSL